MNAKQLVKINKILENKAPNTLVLGLECFVALMRNEPVATNIDVQMYFADFKKLMYCMDHADPTTFDLDVINQHAKTLTTLKP